MDPLRILSGGAGQEDGGTEGEPRTVQLHRLACRRAEDGRGGEDGALFLLDAGPGEDVLLLAGAEVRRLPREAGCGELLDRARRGAAAWGREQLRMLHRLRFPERLIAYAERLAAAQTREAVLAALVEHTPRIAGGYCAVLLAPGADGALQPAEPEPHRMAPVSPPPHPAGASLPDLRGRGPFRHRRPLCPLAPLFLDLGARALAAVPFDGVSLLLLAERRTDRAFEPEDWELLRAAARQAEAALQRVRLFDEVRELSLTDPLTGLANRRQLRLVLERSLAAARRGESLTVAMLDLDDFKAVNEARGHIGGDRVLRVVADALAAEVRGSDLVARYGGDEFLVVLPGGNAASAASLLRRVRERLAGEVSVSAGIAEYGPDAATPDELIDAADRRLYAAKQQVHAGAAAALSRPGRRRRFRFATAVTFCNIPTAARPGVLWPQVITPERVGGYRHARHTPFTPPPRAGHSRPRSSPPSDKGTPAARPVRKANGSPSRDGRVTEEEQPPVPHRPIVEGAPP